MPELLTIAQACEALQYDSVTGVFTWRVRTSSRTPAWSVAGKLRNDGYRIIKYQGAYFYAHRLAFFIGHRREPVGLVDHINGNRDDNRLVNIREANPSQSSENQKLRKDNIAELKGVSYFKGRTRPWRARIRHRGKQKIIGYFHTAKEANEAYTVEAKRLFGRFAREAP